MLRLRHYFLLGSLILLSACATAPSNQPGGALPQAQGNVVAAQQAEAQQDWQRAAAEWLALAGQNVDAQAQAYRLRGLNALLEAGDVLRARVVFDSIDPLLLDAVQQEQLAVSQAALLLQEGRPGEALVALPLALSEQASAELQAKFLAVRGSAFAEQGALISAIEDFTARNRLFLNQSIEQQAWQFDLWPLLVGTEERILKEGLRRTGNSEVAAWLKLGLLGQQEWIDAAGFQRRLDAWQALNSLHVANTALVPALRDAHKRRQTYPQRIVVMLPLSGRFAAVGTAVRDGLLAAWFDLGNNAPAPELEFVDTEGQLPSAWLESQGDLGGLAVVGPLRKEKIDEMLAFERSSELLWLPLNQAGLASEIPFMALALSPEQEARLVAERMGRDGHRRALVIAAEGDWGQRVVEAFNEQFTATGGRVVGVERYTTGQSDYGDTIQRALLLDQSERRHAQITRALGRNIEFEARRRSDVDAVFTPGTPRSLRALRPQLKFYRASALPVYATSHAWAGKLNPAADLDLNGVKFADMPWNLDPSGRDERLKRQISKAGGSAKRGRFFALGADALRVLPILADRESGFPWVFPGGTGLLEPGDDGLLKRKLVWAEFVKGKPRLLPAADINAGLPNS